VFPELNHNEVMGWGPLDDLNSKFKIIYLKDRDDHSQITRRMELTRKIVEKHTGDTIIEIKSRGESLLTRIFSLIYLGDLVSLYLAVENQVDPTSIENIDFLKQGLVGGLADSYF
jgi:glucose/mannose-6-phosphate isomerase